MPFQKRASPVATPAVTGAAPAGVTAPPVGRRGHTATSRDLPATAGLVTRFGDAGQRDLGEGAALENDGCGLAGGDARVGDADGFSLWSRGVRSLGAKAGGGATSTRCGVPSGPPHLRLVARANGAGGMSAR